ncbi:MAG: FeoA domain-containing protein [Chloroflexi bacterium]|nr:FeoA domain-containing protein [Chloroflexota bacterium]
MYDPLTALIFGLVVAAVTAVIVWPEKGIWARWQKNSHLNERVMSEDALKHIYKFEMKGQRPTRKASLASSTSASMIPPGYWRGWKPTPLLTLTGEVIQLTPNGREAALHIIRAHRLYEHYLAEETGYDEAEWHGQAERLEHLFTPAQIDDLAAQLGHPTYDPHGDPIPTAAGQLITHGGRPLTAMAPDTLGQIVHLEDEPEIVYAQLAAEGLYPGMSIRIIEKTPNRIRFWANGDEHILAPIVAANISVTPIIPQEEAMPVNGRRLSQLPIGETAEVIAISRRCRGAERRRFMDLGILPGAQITAEMRSPGGDPTAYIIRDALIALRSDQAAMIQVKKAAA